MTISKMLHAGSAAIAGFSIATALTIGAVAQTDSKQARRVMLCPMVIPWWLNYPHV